MMMGFLNWVCYFGGLLFGGNRPVILQQNLAIEGILDIFSLLGCWYLVGPRKILPGLLRPNCV